METAPTNGSATSSYFETPYMAYRPSRSWYSFFHMPYQKSIKVELVGAPELPGPVSGEVWSQHEDTPWTDGTDSYFHSRFAYQPKLRFPWQPAIWSPPQGGWQGPGQLVGISMRFSAGSPWVSKFNQTGTFEHICEGNWELYIDNTTQLYGNNTSVDIAVKGYQASDHVAVFTGSEDFFGYSFGWAGQQTGLLTGTGLHQFTETSADLQTYRFFDHAPMQFKTSLSAQVNWHYDTGHNVPTNLCPPGTGCEVEYDVMSYLYLAKPHDASKDARVFPWGPN